MDRRQGPVRHPLRGPLHRHLIIAVPHEIPDSPSLGAVPAGAVAGSRGGLQRAAVDHHPGRLGAAALLQPQQHTQVVHQGLEAACRQPALGLLVDQLPWRQVVRLPAPRRPGLRHVAQAIEALAQGIAPLAGILPQQRQIRRHQRPFLVRDVGRIRSSGHPILYGNLVKVPNGLQRRQDHRRHPTDPSPMLKIATCSASRSPFMPCLRVRLGQQGRPATLLAGTAPSNPWRKNHLPALRPKLNNRRRWLISSLSDLGPPTWPIRACL